MKYTFKIQLMFLMIGLRYGLAHLNGDRTQLAELKRYCDHAYSCHHDEIIACGKSVNEARTFLDLCDMYEFSCEHNMVYRHVKDEETCPNPRDLPFGVG